MHHFFPSSQVKSSIEKIKSDHVITIVEKKGCKGQRNRKSATYFLKIIMQNFKYPVIGRNNEVSVSNFTMDQLTKDYLPHMFVVL